MEKINGGVKNVFFLATVFLGFCLLFFLPIISSADPLDNWHWRNPLPQGNALYGVTYGNNTFVAVGYSGTILTSPEGTTWTVRTTGSTKQLHGVSYGNNTFVAVGDRGTILTSSDGITWTKRSSETPNQLFGISYENNIFMVVGASGTILTSPDGISWTKRSSEISYDLLGITFGNNIFVAVGMTYSTILTSADGITWTARLTGFSMNFTGITFGNNIFVAVGNAGNIVTSSDGITWISRGYGTTNYLNGVTYGNNSFVAVGMDGTILSSTDGITWIKRFSGTSYQINGTIYTNNTFFAVGDGGTILSSQNGINWTQNTLGISSVHTGVSYGNNTFVAVGPNGMILVSPDGKTWTTWFLEISNNLNGVIYGNNTFVAVGDNGTILTSTDGITWTQRLSITSNALWGVTYGNNKFVAVGQWGTILTSTNGTSWTERPPDEFTGLFGVGYGNKTFVVVGGSGRLMTSVDGASWIVKFSDANSPAFRGVAYGNNTLVVVGDSGSMVTSPDGNTWTKILTGTLNNLRGVTYGNDTFVAVGQNGTILISSDGASWTNRFSATGLNGVTYGKTTFVAVGEGGTILQSDSVLQTTISSKPSNPTNNTIGNFIFSANDPGATFQCQLDSGDFATCASSAIYSELSDGNHNFTVKATAEGILEATPPSYTWIVDTILPTGSIAINGGAERTNNATATLTLNSTDDNGVAQMQFSNDGINWFTPESFATTKTWTLTTGDGTKTLYVEYLDNAGNWSDTYTSSIILDMTLPVTTVNPAGGLYNASQSLTLIANEPAVIYYTLDGSKPTTDSTVYSNPVNITATTSLKYFAKDSSGNNEIVKTSIYYIDTIPPTGSIIINGGAARTNNPEVTLALSANEASGVAQMQFSNDILTWFTSEAFTTTKTWVLAGGDGVKTIYVMYMDNAGNWSAPFSNTIILDTALPTGSIVINGGAENTNNEAVTLTLNASDAYEVTHMQFSNDKINWSSPEGYLITKTWTLTGGDGAKTVYVKFKDNAGNWSTAFSNTIILDKTPPIGSIIINEGAARTKNAVVTLSLNATDTNGVAFMKFNNDNVAWSFQEEFLSTKIWTLTTGDGTKSVYVKYKDNAGNWSTALSTTIILDTISPTGNIIINGGETKTNKEAVTLTLSASDVNGISKMQFSNDNLTWFTPESFETTKTWVLTGGDGVKTIYVVYIDNAGNWSNAFSNTIILDTTPPIGSITINEVAERTNNVAVILTLSATDTYGIAQMQFSNDNVAWSLPEPYATAKTWTISTIDGTKTVYVKYKDNAGNWSSVYSATITLDTIPPETIITSSPTNPSNVTAPNFSFSSNETEATFQCRLGSGNYTNCTSPVIYTGLADGTYIFSVKATDVAGNTDTSPASYTWTVDTTAPTVTSFVIPAYAKLYTVNITTLTATDKIGVTGYMVTESPNAPNFTDAGWSATVSASYTLTTVGPKTLHAWAKDGAGNVSVSKSATVIVDTTPPTVTAFLLPSTSNTLRVPITTFTATDDTDGSGVTGYIVTESNIAPNVGDDGWSATVPANYTFTTEGSKMLNAWAKDAAGNVSEGKSASVNIQILYGDINGDNIVDLKDALLALQVLAGSNPSGIRSDYAFSGIDVNGDNKIGLAEVIYILQILSGIR